jgi:protein-L-isoaspartate(D-aspartate) O-methyltransferase
VREQQRLRGIGMTSQRTRERLVRRLGDAGIRNVHVLNVMRHVPRHLFVDEALASRAYEDSALPIGHGQTISQPWVVARMTEVLLEAGTPSRVLEVGTGSGYQAAVLASLVPELYTIERLRALYQRCRVLFRQLNLRNVHQRLGDGFAGWPDRAPFDAIMLTAAPQALPQALLEQLAVGGRLVAPVGGAEEQWLRVIERDEHGYHSRDVARVSFVPMRDGVE